VTPVETVFYYGNLLREPEMRAIHEIREVYGIRKVLPDDKAQSIRVEYDASRLNENDVAALLREAGVSLCQPGKAPVPL
jgi:hypothetical protein